MDRINTALPYGKKKKRLVSVDSHIQRTDLQLPSSGGVGDRRGMA